MESKGVTTAVAETQELWSVSSGQARVMGTQPCCGRPEPLGAVCSSHTGAVNFALFASGATSVSLVLFTAADLASGRITAEVPLDPAANRTGDVWHVLMPQLQPDILYGFRLGGPHQDDDPEQALGHRFDARQVVLDPYARAVLSRREYGKLGPDVGYGQDGVLGLSNTWPQAAGHVPSLLDVFDWEGDRPLQTPMEQLVIYEMHVRGFTQGAGSGVNAPGTYSGLVERLDYLAALGVNAIELMPVHEFNELEYYSPIPDSPTNAYRFNFWGYSTVNFFSPMSRYSSAVAAGGGGTALANEFKSMVKACHQRGIEVILDVVFNHTAEGNDQGPTLSFRGLDNRIYYTLAPGGEYYNYSGCGNTLNCNQPVVRQFVMDSLRYWVTEYHIDGFRFDLASIMTRAHSVWHPQQFDAASLGTAALHSAGGVADLEGIMSDGAGAATGTPLAEPSLVEMISEDPVLRSTKMIAEAWDCAGLNQVGSFPHYGGRWSEWNGQFRDTLRMFIKGSDGPWAGNFASAMCGSPNVYASKAGDDDWWGSTNGRQWRGTRGPTASINFVTAHDGFALSDLVMYNEKHNDANGEGNRDGEGHNNSWNCGEEGPSELWPVRQLRQRQMRNLAAGLLLAHGVPMLVMGDEYGHTKDGNNNTYCHDSELNYLDWAAAQQDEAGLLRFVSCLIRLRRSRPELQRSTYVTDKDVQWHGEQPLAPDWTEASRLVAYTLTNSKGGGLYIAFNTGHTPKLLELPAWPGRVWQPIMDTSRTAPFDILVADGQLSVEDVAAARASASMWVASGAYALLPWSCCILDSVPDTATHTLKYSAAKGASKGDSSGNGAVSSTKGSSSGSGSSSSSIPGQLS